MALCNVLCRPPGKEGWGNLSAGQNNCQGNKVSAKRCAGGSAVEHLQASIIGTARKNTEAEEEEEEPTTNRCGVQRKHVGTLYALE